MKNQYVADIGDYGKYSLLRAFIDAGVKVGVNWYLTKNDDSADGRFTDYLVKDKLRRYSPEIFDVLRSIATKDNKTVTDIQNSGILPGAEYYSELLEPQGSKANKEQQRKEWFEKSADVLSDAELIFMDPDNGLLESGGAEKITRINMCFRKRWRSTSHADTMSYIIAIRAGAISQSGSPTKA